MFRILAYLVVMCDKFTRVTAMIIIASLTLTLFNVMPVGSVEAEGTYIVVPGDYSTVQEAIDNAASGDTIIVYNGTYRESIVIDKSLNLHGQDKSNTFIDAMGDGVSAIKITADNVTVSGFTVFNSTNHGVELSGANEVYIFNMVIHNCSNTGIYASGSDYTFIENCTIHDTLYGLNFWASHEKTIINSEIFEVDYTGVLVSRSSHVTLINCTIAFTGYYGLYFEKSLETVIIQCDLYNTTYDAMYFYDSDYVYLFGCEIYNCPYWYTARFHSSDFIIFVECLFHDNANTACIYMVYCDDVIVAITDFYDCQDSTGVILAGCRRVFVYECGFANLSTGISTQGTDNVEIKSCWFENNEYQGVYLEGSDITSICGCTFLDNTRGIWLSGSHKTYVARSAIHNSVHQGIYMDGSSMVLSSSNFTGNLESVYGYHSNLKAQFNRFENNTNYGLICNYYSNFNASDNWWGDASGPYHWLNNPTGTGDRVSDNIAFEPWQTEPYQPEALISDMRCNLQYESWNVVYPDDEAPKPLGCAAASVSDWLASNYVSTKIRNYQEGQDTDPAYVNQATGAPVGDPGTQILTFGGPFVNPIVKRAEDHATPEADRAPVRFHDESGIFHFQHRNGTNIPGAELPVSVINNHEDMFVLERYMDGDGRVITICYGFGWKGTYAAGKFFEEEVFPSLGAYTDGWIIVHWEDTDMDGFVDLPWDGDTYTVIASGN